MESKSWFWMEGGRREAERRKGKGGGGTKEGEGGRRPSVSERWFLHGGEGYGGVRVRGGAFFFSFFLKKRYSYVDES